jgi:hypothetical protein
MTPNQLLNVVALGFPILLVDSDEQLQAILLRALAFYQTKFGQRKLIEVSVDLESGLSSSLPDNCLQRICLTDKLGQGYFSQIVMIGDDNKLKVDLDAKFKNPASLMYFVDLAGGDYANDKLPPESVPILQDYLDILIRIPNNEVKSALAAQSEIADPTVEDHQQLLTRKRELEGDIIASAPPLPIVSFS